MTLREAFSQLIKIHILLKFYLEIISVKTIKIVLLSCYEKNDFIIGIGIIRQQLPCF